MTLKTFHYIRYLEQAVSVLRSLKDFISKYLLSERSEPGLEGSEEIKEAVSRTLNTVVIACRGKFKHF